MFDPVKLQLDFPILQRQVHGKRLVYLDNAATSQKPRSVIQAISNYYENHNANVHRGVHQLGDESTQLFHQSRQKIAIFFGAKVEELVIVRNTTEAINQVAMTWGQEHVRAGDTILLTEFEHHSNLVPWQILASLVGAQLAFVKVTEDGELDRADFRHWVQRESKIALFAISHVSNALGTLNPLLELKTELLAKHPQAKMLVDGAQAAPHLPVNFKELGADFYVVSAHKMLGPMGIGGLLVVRELLSELRPFFTGGGMIDTVDWQETAYAEDLEDKFTAGTPDVASLSGWAAACEYLSQLGMKKLADHDHDLVAHGLNSLAAVPELKLVGSPSATHRVGSVAFIYHGVHAHDVGQVLDSEGIAVRSGHHCTMPLHTKFGWAATVRASFQLYNSTEDIDQLIAALAKVKTIFGV